MLTRYRPKQGVPRALFSVFLLRQVLLRLVSADELADGVAREDDVDEVVAVAGAGLAEDALAAGVVLVRGEHAGLRARIVVALTHSTLAFLLLVPWGVRGVLLSGYPAYPSTAFGLDVE